jgi:hypothetical protein
MGSGLADEPAPRNDPIRPAGFIADGCFCSQSTAKSTFLFKSDEH